MGRPSASARLSRPERRLGARLLDRSPAASELEMREAISGNLCRCTGYGRIFAAFRQVQQERADARA